MDTAPRFLLFRSSKPIEPRCYLGTHHNSAAARSPSTACDPPVRRSTWTSQNSLP